jgi:hypothetical protein
MISWTVKIVTDNRGRALEIVQGQWKMGYTAWIEEENGPAKDEKAVKIGKLEKSKLTPVEMGKDALVVTASAVAAIGVLYLLGVWVDR